MSDTTIEQNDIKTIFDKFLPDPENPKYSLKYIEDVSKVDTFENLIDMCKTYMIHNEEELYPEYYKNIDQYSRVLLQETIELLKHTKTNFKEEIKKFGELGHTRVSIKDSSERRVLQDLEGFLKNINKTNSVLHNIHRLYNEGEFDFINREIGGRTVSPITSHKYSGGILYNDKIYTIPYRSEYISVYDTNDVETIDMELATNKETYNIPTNITDDYRFFSAVLVNDKIFYIPYRSKYFIVLDLIDETVHRIDFELPDINSFYNAVYDEVTGKIFCLPSHETHIYVIDTNIDYKTAPANSVVYPIGDDLGTTGVKFMSGIVNNGFTYLIPTNNDKIIRIKNDDNSITTFTTDYDRNGGYKWVSSFLVGNSIYCIPYSYSYVLKINIDENGDITSKFIGPNLGGGAYKWHTGVLHEGFIYAAPFYNETDILRIDTNTDHVEKIKTGITYPRRMYKHRDFQVLNGKLYAVPYYANELLIFDPNNLKTSTLGGYPNTYNYMGGIVHNDKLYAIPYYVPNYQVISVKEDSPTNEIFDKLINDLELLDINDYTELGDIIESMIYFGLLEDFNMSVDDYIKGDDENDSITTRILNVTGSIHKTIIPLIDHLYSKLIELVRTIENGNFNNNDYNYMYNISIHVLALSKLMYIYLSELKRRTS